MGLFPRALIIDGKSYLVAGTQKRQPQFKSGQITAQIGDFQRPRLVMLGRGEAGIIGSRRSQGWPSPHGVADVVNGDTTLGDRYGAGALATQIALTAHALISEADTPSTITDDAAVGANAWTNPANAGSSNNTYATNGTSGQTHYLKALNPAPTIPVGGLITGIKVGVERKATGGGTTTLTLTSAEQTYVVPAGVHELTIDCQGAEGSTGSGGATAGLGARVQTTLVVTPGETLYIYVGGVGTGQTGGYNGGGNGVAASASGAGGGASDVRQGGNGTANRVVTAGGGGGGSNVARNGGDGGASGVDGEDAIANAAGGGKGGTPTTDGAGGVAGSGAGAVAGSAASGAQGGNGGDGGGGDGGGGGGGFHGGGGGGTGGTGGGGGAGGGGSSVAGTGTSGTTITSGFRNGSGQVIITTNSIVDNAVRLVVGGVVSGNDKADITDHWPLSDTLKEYGGSSDTWGLTLTRAQVIDATFGVVLSADVTSGSCSVDAITITAYWVVDRPGTVTKLWSDSLDSESNPVRYIYAMHGSSTSVIDPVTDAEVEVKLWDSTVDGGDAARRSGKVWLALRGDAADFVQQVTTPYDGIATVYTPTDYTAIAIHAGPDALYRALQDFGANFALVKKTDTTAPADIDGDANWTPAAGETMGDPSTRITRLATLGERLVAGKEDGLHEFDRDFIGRAYLEWQREFRWKYNNNALLPLGQGGDLIVAYRRGLYLLPANQSVGVEELEANETEKKGRYTALNFDGQSIWAWLENPRTLDTHVMRMHRRSLQAPGLFDHHPVHTLVGKQTLTSYFWPGALVDGVRYGPRMYYGAGDDAIEYINLGETMPWQDDTAARFAPTWSITWPYDDFGSPTTLKVPYRFGGRFKNVDGTSGITISCSVAPGEAYEPLSDDGGGLHVPIRADGRHERYGARDNTLRGYTLSYRISGTGGLPTLQQRMEGQPEVYILEQPDKVMAYAATLELRVHDANDEDAEGQLQALYALLSAATQEVICQWGENEPDTTLYALVKAEREGEVVTSEAPGAILAQLELHTLQFSDDH